MKSLLDIINNFKIGSYFSVSSGDEGEYQMRLNAYILGTATVGLLLFLSILNLAGRFGALVGGLLLFAVGRGALLIPLFFWLCTFLLIKVQGEKQFKGGGASTRVGWGGILMIWAFLALLNLIFGIDNPNNVINGGGFVGYLLYPFLLNNSSSFLNFGVIGSLVIILVISIFGFFLITGQKYTQFVELILDYARHPNKIWDLIPDIFEIFNKSKPIMPIMAMPEPITDDLETPDDSFDYQDNPDSNKNDPHTSYSVIDEASKILEQNSSESDLEDETGKNFEPLADTVDLAIEESPGEFVIKPKTKYRGSWQKPNLNLLIENTDHAAIPIDVDENKQKIKSTFGAFGIEVTMGNSITGPTVSQYTFRPASGVKLSRINSLQNDLALALAAKSIRMELPIPGQSAASIEIPNPVKRIVRIKDLLSAPGYKNFTGPLPMAVGQDVSGQNIIFSLAKAPHLLVAGATGAGKSVWINSMLLSFLYKYSPTELQLILVDMKMVELNLYDGIPHLLTPVITESENAINALKWSIFEMNRRYKMLKMYGKRNIADFNDFAVSVPDVKPLPYTVFVIDELADLMMQAKSEVEPIIARLTAMSRAVGIHLVLGTQRPDTTVVTGLIKTNIPTRICFAVVTQIDSRVILDFGGGENLLGQGDGLLKSPASIQPIRFQGAFVDEKEVKKVVEELATQLKYRPEMNNFDPDVIEPPAGVVNVPGLKTKKIDASDGVLLYERAKELVMDLGHCSPNIIAGNLDIDLKTAKYVIEELEGNGIVGPEVPGMVGREVLVSN